LLLSGCGLESFIALSAPTTDYTYPSLTFQFTKQDTSADLNQDGDYVFQGFELYYKIYGLAENPENDIGIFDQLGPRGFRRINNYPKDYYSSYPLYHKPLIDLSTLAIGDRNKTFLITIDFNKDLTDAIVSADYPKIYSEASAPISITINAIRRDVPYTVVPYTNEFKRFSADSRTILSVYEQTDDDLSNAAWIDISTTPGPHTARIALYVLSYGFDPMTSSVLYSLPVYLGYLDNLTLPYP
jgi:hypothetical protein